MRRMAMAVALCFVSAVAFAQDVKTDFDKSANFGAIKTFAVKIGTSWNNQISERQGREQDVQGLPSRPEGEEVAP